MAKKYRYTLPFEDSGIQLRLEALAAHFGEDYIYNGKPSPKRLIEAIAYEKIPLGKTFEKVTPQFWLSTWSSIRWQSLLVAVWLSLQTKHYATACELVSILLLRSDSDSFWREHIAYLRATDWFLRYELLQQFISSSQPFALDYHNGSLVESHVIRHAFIDPLFPLGLVRAFSASRRLPDIEPVDCLACNYRFRFDRILQVQPITDQDLKWLPSLESIEVSFELPNFSCSAYQRHPSDLSETVLSDGRLRVKRRVYDTSELCEDLVRYLPNFEILSPISVRSYFRRIALRMLQMHSPV
jgi:hypothetical protein